MAIHVVNKRTHIATPLDVYIGRPSTLGNPYEVKTWGRDKCIELYLNEIVRCLTNKKDTTNFIYNKVAIAMNLIYKKSLSGDVYLVCWCAPENCHGHVIKRLIDDAIAGKLPERSEGHNNK